MNEVRFQLRGLDGASYDFMADLGAGRLLTLTRVKAGKQAQVLFSRSFSSVNALITEYEKQFAKLVGDGTDFIGADGRPARRAPNLWSLTKKAAEKGLGLAAAGSNRLKRDQRAINSEKAFVDANLSTRDVQALKRFCESTDIDAIGASVAVALEISYDDEGGDCPVGVSKYGGTPDLPSGVRSPKNMEFLAQLDLRELAPANDGRVPSEGLVFVFANPEGEGKVVFSKKPAKAAPNREPGQRMRFTSRFMFSDAVPSPARFVEALPPGLKAKLGAIWGSVAPLEQFACDRVFGEPVDLQATGNPFGADGNDERGEEEEEGAAASGEVVAGMGLLLQSQFGEGFVLVGVPHTDAGRDALTDAAVAYSGS